MTLLLQKAESEATLSFLSYPIFFERSFLASVSNAFTAFDPCGGSNWCGTEFACFFQVLM